MLELKPFLQEHLKTLRDDWFELTLSAYPEASRPFFEKVVDGFNNPVGATLYESLTALLEELLQPAPDEDRVLDQVANIMAVKAVQEVSPSKAVSVFPAFKQVVMRAVCPQGKWLVAPEALIDFFDELDTVALYAFDVYYERRVQIYEMRLAQIKANNDILVRANLLDQALDMEDFMRCASSMGDEGGAACGSCPSARHCPSDESKGV
ncbi:RsbRD N-terminal domain-containing protein [Peptococcus simiae]|uniref:RsbRD N-terminal domain-containing protein n=1 Tax=Peptococcus simiae TaxID=1643805 RepID=UPI00397EF2AB